MSVAPGLRAVVFTPSDLPARDREHIARAAALLGWPVAPGAPLWRTPLLLTAVGTAPAELELRDDAALATGGPPELLLTLRLLWVDALHWPELRELGIHLERGETHYALYAADPERYDAEGLARALATHGPVCHGLGERPARPPCPPQDRVPVLGWEVPVLGGELAQLRDLRPPEERAYVVAGVRVPRGLRPSHRQEPYALFLGVGTALRSDSVGEATVQLMRIDTRDGSTWSGTLTLGLEDLESLDEACGSASPGALRGEELRAWLADLLPGCLLATPNGALLVLDLYRLGLQARALRSHDGGPAPVLRLCAGPEMTAQATAQAVASEAAEEDADPSVLDPALWSPDCMADLLDHDLSWVSPGGRYVFLQLVGSCDGAPLHGSALLDTEARPDRATVLAATLPC